jgi:hypothetical protein
MWWKHANNMAWGQKQTKPSITFINVIRFSHTLFLLPIDSHYCYYYFCHYYYYESLKCLWTLSLNPFHFILFFACNCHYIRFPIFPPSPRRPHLCERVCEFEIVCKEKCEAEESVAWETMLLCCVFFWDLLNYVLLHHCHYSTFAALRTTSTTILLF